MKKTVNYFTLIVMVFISMTMQSCSKGEAERRAEYSQIVERKSASDAMNELYIAADGEIESLARMLQATPSVINRIRTGETSPTEDFEEKYKEVLVYYNLNDRSFSKLQSALDVEYDWYDSVLNFPSHHPVLFWGINIILFLLLCWYLIIILGYIYLAEIILFAVAWVALLI